MTSLRQTRGSPRLHASSWSARRLFFLSFRSRLHCGHVRAALVEVQVTPRCYRCTSQDVALEKKEEKNTGGENEDEIKHVRHADNCGDSIRPSPRFSAGGSAAARTRSRGHGETSGKQKTEGEVHSRSSRAHRTIHRHSCAHGGPHCAILRPSREKAAWLKGACDKCLYSLSLLYISRRHAHRRAYEIFERARAHCITLNRETSIRPSPPSSSPSLCTRSTRETTNSFRAFEANLRSNLLINCLFAKFARRDLPIPREMQSPSHWSVCETFALCSS